MPTRWRVIGMECRAGHVQHEGGRKWLWYTPVLDTGDIEWGMRKAMRALERAVGDEHEWEPYEWEARRGDVCMQVLHMSHYYVWRVEVQINRTRKYLLVDGRGTAKTEQGAKERAEAFAKKALALYKEM